MNLRAPRVGTVLHLFPLVWFLALAHPAHASTSAAYGEKFVRAGQHWGDARPAGGGAVQADEPPDAGNRWQKQLAVIEAQGGPYADALAQPLSSLARHYRRQGDPQQAQRMLSRALHVVRVNDGLSSERQLPILRELLQIYRETGDLTTLDQRYDYYFRLYGGGRPPFTDTRLRASLEYLRWQREAVRLRLDGESLRRLVRLIDLNEDILGVVALDDALDPSWYRELVYSQLRNLYLLQVRVQPRIEQMGMLESSLLYAVSEQDPGGFELRLATMQRGAYNRGASLLQTLIDNFPESAPAALARARRELGDWYQWHGSTERAAQEYTTVVQLLQEAREPELLETWFAQPVELPDNGAFWQPRQTPEGRSSVRLEAVYDVSARGRPGNIETTILDGSEEGAAARLRRELAGTRFRPRWLEGHGEDVARLVREYELVD